MVTHEWLKDPPGLRTKVQGPTHNSVVAVKFGITIDIESSNYYHSAVSDD